MALNNKAAIVRGADRRHSRTTSPFKSDLMALESVRPERAFKIPVRKGS
jgi:hypothetical protein